MKRLIAMLLAVCAVAFNAAADDETFEMTVNEIRVISVSFGIRSYTPGSKDVVRIEKISDTSFRVTGLKPGGCTLEVRGELDNMVKRYNITVSAIPLPVIKKNLDRELELGQVDELATSIIGNSIRISGNIHSINKWNYLRKVLAGKEYSDMVRNFAEFHPGDDLLKKVKENLRQCGFEVMFATQPGEPKAWKMNCVALSYNSVNRTMNVQARVCTPEQSESIAECIGRESAWLAAAKDEKRDLGGASDDEWKVRLNMRVVVAKPIVRLSVAYMAIGESDIRRIGNTQANTGDGPLQLTGAFDILYNLVHGSGHSTRNATVGASLGVTTRFLAQNQISRVSDIGYTLIESWSKDGAKFKSGGTRYVKTGNVSGNNSISTGSSDLKEISYGFEINAKGGMVNDHEMVLDFDFDISTLLYVDGEDSYDRKEDKSKLNLKCPIGRTTLVSGFMDMLDKKTPPSGIPFLRNTPIVNWFVADSGKEVSDRRLVIMICPEIVDSTQDAKPDVNKEINIRVQDQGSKDTDDVYEGRKRFSGFWYWLNWFCW